MKHLGDFDTSAVVYGKFTTFRPSTGAAYTLGGTPALSVYKDNSTTQSTTGITLTADFDSVTGLNHFAIDTSADGTFYSSGSFFDIVITTGTVDSVSVVGAVVGSFTLRKNSALKPATAGRTVVVDASGLVDANTVKVGPTGSGTAQTAGDLAALVTAVDDYVDTEVAAIKAKTDNLPADPADASDIAASFSTVNSTLATIAAYIDTEVAAIKAKTDNLPAAPAATSDIPTATENADALLQRNVSNVEGTAGEHTLCTVVLAMLEHSISGTTLTIKRTDGSTTHATKTLSTNAAADPITGIT